MSGLETIKVIVDAEKEAAKIISDAMTRAAQIRKGLDSTIQEQRQHALADARKEATASVARAEGEGKSEAEVVEREADELTRDLVSRASSKKEETVTKLVAMVMEAEK